MSNLSQNQHDAKRRNADACINPCEILPEPDPADKQRHHHTDSQGRRRNQQLFACFSDIKPGQDDKSDAQKQAHIIYQQPVDARICHGEYHHGGKNDDL